MITPPQPIAPKTAKPPLAPEISIKELSDHYPELVETLILDYGFHCVGCFASEFETLEEGARVHGIVDQDFEELLNHLQSLAKTSEVSAVAAEVLAA